MDTCANRSRKPSGAGVPFRPHTMGTLAVCFLTSLYLGDFGFLSLPISSKIHRSKGLSPGGQTSHTHIRFS